MPPDDQTRLRHLTEAARKAISYASEQGRPALDDNELLRLALAKLVEIVGEAAKQVSQETKVAYPDVAWSSAARMRDRLVHHYFDINVDVLWSTVTEDLPELLARLPDLEA